MLLPVVAAMLILLLAGVGLVELSGAQTMQSVHTVEAVRAYWAAEAGLWHAAHEEAAIGTPVVYAGSSYTVTKSGNDYTATATHQNATKVLTFTFVPEAP